MVHVFVKKIEKILQKTEFNFETLFFVNYFLPHKQLSEILYLLTICIAKAVSNVVLPFS